MFHPTDAEEIVDLICDNQRPIHIYSRCRTS